ncbi:Hypothetical predicted protein [Paramuricea clavata]|uniref:Uncharacterized protein n=1 Tax=Paramuricea clavata TaxID=317549 RepID=A0A7D9IW33_PARCT|nr:Hypothetical predicted protein [Paramuricea clavata]
MVDFACSLKKAIDHGSIDVVMTTDASLLGWGASKGQTSVGRQWSEEDIVYSWLRKREEDSIILIQN